MIAVMSHEFELIGTCLNCGYMLVRENGHTKHGDCNQTWQRCSDRPDNAEALNLDEKE